MDTVDSTGRVLTRADFPNADFGNVSGCTNDQGIYVGNIDEYSSGMNGAESLFRTPATTLITLWRSPTR